MIDDDIPPPPTDDDAPPQRPVALVRSGDRSVPAVCKRADGVEIDPGEWAAQLAQCESALGFGSLMQGRSLKKTPLAIQTVLRLHPYWHGTIKHNAMLRRDECGGEDTSRVVTNRVRVWLEREYECLAAKDDVADAVHALAATSSYHPVEQYLSALPPWDCIPRVADLVNVLAVPDEQRELAKAMIRAWMIGAVKRVLEPGCQMDYMLVLYGKQGMRKTSFWRALAGGYPYYNGLSAKHWTDTYRVHSAWIHECGELEGFTTRAEISEIKAHLTEIGDNITLKWETQATVWLRRCVFCGTTNRDDFLRDETGARRFWIIESLLTAPLDAAIIAKMRDMLWAEILSAYRAGEPCYLADATMAAQQAEQAARYAPKDDPWEMHLEKVIMKARSSHEPIRVASLLDQIGVNPERQDRLSAMRVTEILRGNGFEKKVFRDGNRTFKGWWYPNL